MVVVVPNTCGLSLITGLDLTLPFEACGGVPGVSAACTVNPDAQQPHTNAITIRRRTPIWLLPNWFSHLYRFGIREDLKVFFSPGFSAVDGETQSSFTNELFEAAAGITTPWYNYYSLSH